MRILKTIDASGVTSHPFAASIDTIAALEIAHFTPIGGSPGSATTAQILSSTLSELNDIRIGGDEKLVALIENLLVLCSRLDARVTALENAP